MARFSLRADASTKSGFAAAEAPPPVVKRKETGSLQVQGRHGAQGVSCGSCCFQLPLFVLFRCAQLPLPPACCSGTCHSTQLQLPRCPPQVRNSRPLAHGAALQWQQFTALTRRHLLIRQRAWKTNVLLVLQAVLFILLIWAVDKAVSASRQRQPAFSSVPVAAPQQVSAVPLCTSNRFMRHGQPCYTFLYAPTGDPTVEAVVRGVMAGNTPPIPPQQVLAFVNASDIDPWLLRHPETVRCRGRPTNAASEVAWLVPAN